MISWLGSMLSNSPCISSRADFILKRWWKAIVLASASAAYGCWYWPCLVLDLSP